MKTVTTALSLLLTMWSYSQDCKPYQKVKDDFLEQTINIYGAKLGTERSMLAGVSITSYLFASKINDSTYTLTFSLQFYQQESDASVNNVHYPKGTPFMLKTSDGLKIYTSENVSNTKKKMASKILTISNMATTVSKADMEYLSNSTITAYRVAPSEGSVHQGTVSSGKALKLQQQINCLLNGKEVPTADTGLTEPQSTDFNKTPIINNSNISSYFGFHAGIRSYYYNDYTSNSPLLTISYEQGIIKPLGIRAFIGYGTTKDGGYVDRYVSFGASVIYYPYIQGKFKFYLSVGFGLSRDIGYYWLPIKFLIRGGGRYQFNETLGAYADIGFGLSVVNLGISFKMKSKK